MRAYAVAAVFSRAQQLLTLQAIGANHTTAWLGGVVLGGVQPLAALVEYRVAVEMTPGRRGQRLQQATVAGVDQVALGAGAATDEQGHGQAGVRHHVMAAFAHRSGEGAFTVEAIADRVVVAVAIVTG